MDGYTLSEKQFYKEDYKTSDYGSLMHKYEQHLQHNEKLQVKKTKNAQWEKKRAQLRKWTETDQLFEDELWAS